ncbi:uncharacterized protein KQ657_002558 [Scheffersomyces spartinae]|uniref:CID domain-containing protein n=1 Tax=Scheffersomyces spartinae TaxID=45513 RepID=A0A9P8AGS7_9ASCO|nr:uncharacterized protein KQ657_002558 [Scheffersomyces spartinae]KAG7191952.1 hypothetical protein KQ657_002558 [Scheffersomyces spartinae]
MSYSAEALSRKLSTLQDTQDSIVSVSQWVLFHHRHSKESAKVWADYVTGNPHLLRKKLTLLYLCNEVIQQARHKRKTEFLDAYFEVLPSVLNEIYKEMDSTIQGKVERLLNVWNQRNIFNNNQIAAMKNAIELSKASKSLTEGVEEEKRKQEALSVVVAPELKFINDLILNINKLEDSNQPNLSQVGIQSKTYLPEDPSGSDNLPSPKIYISKLNILEKLCDVSLKTLEEINTQRSEVLGHLKTLETLLSDGAESDKEKVKVLNERKLKLVETRNELRELLEDEADDSTATAEAATAEAAANAAAASNAANAANAASGSSTSNVASSDEEASPAFESINEDDDDDIPQYENEGSDEDSDDDDGPVLKKPKVSPPTEPEPTHSSKIVAFSDDVQVREYVKEDLGEGIRIVKSDSEASDDDVQQEEDVDEDEEVEYKFLGLSEDEDLLKFESRHKDAVDLKHDQEVSTSLSSSVLDLLSKLA